MTTIRRVVVLGHTGMIGARVMAQLADLAPGLDVTGAALNEIDLSDTQSAEGLAPRLGPETCVVMCAAIKRQLGDSPTTYQRNTQILTTFAELIGRNPVGRVVYLSSAAVYGEDVENLAITEDTPLVPRTYYGLSKITAEWILQRVVDGGGAGSLGLVRPATVYGPGDVATAYGPSGFLDAAVHDRPLTLWGDGMELREFLYVDDVAKAIARYALLDHSGPLNLVAGVSYTFQDALDAVEAAVGRRPPLSSRPRSKSKVDNRFDAALLRTVLPEIAFTPLAEGVRLTHEARYSRMAS